MSKNQKQVALVTGGNKGLGLEIARQLGRLGHTVVLGSRDAKRGEEAAAKLVQRGPAIDFAARIEALKVHRGHLT